ncbi:Chromatin assembly factor 1, subunit A [Geranomyces variabilis]|nr:Chromatin assembly factor 1, subunit A [Geranomyces variabilis]
MEITSTPPPLPNSPAPADATPVGLSGSDTANMDVEMAVTPSETTPQKREAGVDEAGEPDRKRAKKIQTPTAAAPTEATMTDAAKPSRKRPKTAQPTASASKPATSAKREEKQKEKERKTAERAAEKALKEQKIAEKKAEKEKRDAEKEQKIAEKKAEKEKREAERKAAEQKLAEKKAEKEKREAERKAAKAADEAKLSKQRALLGTFFTPVKKTDDAKVKIPDTVASELQTFWQHFPPFQTSARIQIAKYNAFWKSLPEGFPETLFQGAPTKLNFDREPVPPKTPLHDGWKLLQFHGDLRPAYWGGWIKTSKLLSGRRPFAQDPAVLDYDYDSEAEWEEEEPGEIIGSDNEDDEEDGSRAGAESDDEEDSWLVPHGYLSDDEGMANEAGGPPSPNSKIAIHDNNDKKRSKDAPKWGVLAPLVPVIHGPCFASAYFSSETATDERAARQALVHLRAQVLFVDVAIGLDPFEIDPNASSDSITASATTPNAASGGSKKVGPKKFAFPEDQLPDLLTKITGAAGLPKLIDELKASPQFANIPKATLEAKIRDVAVREKRVGDQKARWYVRETVAGSTDSRASSACFSAPTTPTKKKPTIVDLLTSPLRPRAPGS